MMEKNLRSQEIVSSFLSQDGSVRKNTSEIKKNNNKTDLLSFIWSQ